MRTPHTQQPTLDAAAFEQARKPSQASATLVFRWGDARHIAELADGQQLTVGRSSSCDLRLEEPSLSRQHARFRFEGGLVRVEDLESRNGVRARGARVSSARLASGEEALLGNVRTSVIVLAPEAPVTAEPGANGGIEWAGSGMAELRRELEKVAPTPLPVLVLGETGSGKELIARELHRLSPRAKAPMQVINCAAIPENLVESTLFGHEKGAFTGADWAQPGAFEQAKDGTVFLDELGELPLAAQATLLRVLETGHYSRVGSTRERESQARVVAATHRDLQAMVAEGSFRLDLLHRLDAISLHIPPLRDRLDALDQLVELFLRRAERRMRKGSCSLSLEAARALRGYHWPGNVRELRNVIERAVAIADGPVIGLADLPDRVLSSPPNSSAPPPARTAGRDETATHRVHRPTSSHPTQPPDAAAEEAMQHAEETLKERREREERELLVLTLERTGGSQTEAAQLLGCSVRTLQRRVQKYGLSGRDWTTPER